MAKKPAAGAPAWMATFADLMSLLLVLFVLLLTFAEMDVIKYKQIAGSVKAAFGFSKQDELAGVVELDGSILGKALKQPTPDTPRIVSNIPPVETPEVEIKEGDSKSEKAEALEETLETVLHKMGMTNQIGVDRKDGDVVVRFPNEIAFPSGSSGMTAEFAAILNRLVPVINQTEGQVVVSGHTDNIPVSSNSPYISNWDLSAARATSVIHYMIDQNGTDPARMVVQGHGDSRPIADNSTPEGRAQNRRVEIAIEMVDDTESNSSPNTSGPVDGANTGTGSDGIPSPEQRRSFSIPGNQ
ncbi:OmpA family protein [Thalassospira sp. MCCC 1A03138]|uniref:OmpA family protein n=1 Tax=Thalassospira sp. MCCC 1A03138 TaxID=1470576 RepID=UPI000A1FA727|nr:OmpA family protein [Thalassospira sp. MCCC 1A03138]